MTQVEIIKMAREAGGCEIGYGSTLWVSTQSTEFLEAFAKLVAAKERKDAWEAVNALIVFGDIGGNGTDPSAQRGGIVLATNVLADRICRGQA